MKHFIKGIVAGCILTIAPAVGGAAPFVSADGAFTLDMPAGWETRPPASANGVLSLQKDTARIDVKKHPCTTETCLEEKINSDLSEVKRKNMQVVGNAYTGEEIKRIEFSTGEPFFYISFFTPKNNFGAGYFLINSHAYSILARDLTYAETDLIFSFISPRAEPASQPLMLEMDTQDPRAYDIAAAPSVSEETLQPLPQAQAGPEAAPADDMQARNRLKKRLSGLKLQLLSPQMPPYIVHLGAGFGVLIGLLVLFACLQVLAGLVRLCKHTHPSLVQANPHSRYPIEFARLYGTPSLIFRAKDNQGNILISLSSRWDSIFLLGGMLVMGCTLLLLAAAGFCENNQLLPFSVFTYHWLYTAGSLAIALGGVMFACGVVWSQLVLREVSLFNNKGQKAAVVLQKGFGITREHYEIYFARSKEIIVATRKRFSLQRTWQIHTKQGQLLAQLRETSAGRALLRKCCGHLAGFLRADYQITGQMDAQGSLQSTHEPFDRFTCTLDKPQAIQARDLLVASLLVHLRDRDKWYPWFN